MTATSDIAAPDIAAPDIAAPDIATSEEGTAEMIAPEMATTQMGTVENTSTDMATSEMGTVENTSTDMATSEMGTADETATNMATSKMAANNQPMGPKTQPSKPQLSVLLHQASTVPGCKQIHWGPRFHSHLPHPLQQAINSSELSDAAVDAIYRNFAIVVKAEPYKAGTMAPASLFLSTIVPPLGLAAMMSLCLDIEFNDKDWHRVARSVAPKMQSLRSLTIVARYHVDNNIYNFQSTAVLNKLCELVDQAVWPMATLGPHFEQLIVHVHSGAGSWLAGRDPRVEPIYFFERADLEKGQSIAAQVKKSNNGIVRETPREGFMEGIVPTSLVEDVIEQRFRW
ncbi:hypothetical protein PG989_002136 [Apiospora arundinis]